MVFKFTKEAAERLAESWDGISADYVQERAAEALQKPSDAGFWDDDLYNTHTLAFHTPDWDLTDEYIVGEANYRTALRLLSEEFPEDAEAASVGHWTYSRYSCIKVRVVNEKDEIVPSFVALCELAHGLDDYPVLDDEEYSALEDEVWSSSVDMALDDFDPDDEDDELSDQDKEYMRQYIGEHYYLYDGASYIHAEWMEEAFKFARGEHQQHQEVSLF